MIIYNCKVIKALQQKNKKRSKKMKEIKKMNSNELMAFKLAKDETGFYISGLENQMDDNPIGSEDWNSANAVLTMEHNELVDLCYRITMERTERSYLKHLRFAGQEFIKECISTILTKKGY